jgi:F420-non-reducing hydrogenase iron-sulfur subunit
LPLVLSEQGIDPKRFALEWVSSAEASRFAELVTRFTETIRSLGPNPLKQNRKRDVRYQVSDVSADAGGGRQFDRI